MPQQAYSIIRASTNRVHEPLIEARSRPTGRTHFVLASGTISRETPCIEDLRATMKGKIAGVLIGCARTYNETT